MIEKMKMLYVVSSVSNKKEMLDGLRDLGILHLAEKKSADRAVSDKFATLSKTIATLGDYGPDKKEKKTLTAKPVLSESEFESLYQSVLDAIDKKESLAQQSSAALAEIERILPWGSFSPEEISEIREAGYDLHFYTLSKEAYEAAKQEENISIVKLAPIEKNIAIAAVGKLPSTIPAAEFALPTKSVEQLRGEIKACEAESAKCDEILKDAALYDASFQEQLLKLQNEEIYSSANETAQGDGDFIWLAGYIPEAEMDRFKKAAAENKWAWAVEDVAEDDDQIPTKVKYNKVSGLIKPVFDILGILPGYRETDISLWFFLFFILFFAMIIGDAGYGALILIGTIAFAAKTKKKNTAVFLLLVLSIATIIWGAITGTWFGLEQAMNVPFLKALVLPGFANYPEYFGVSALAQQNNIMKFSFTIGVVQMALGSLIAIKKKLAAKDLSWIANLGWLFAVVAMYLLSLYLVIGENINVVPVFAIVGVAFAMVVVFGGMSPDKTFAQGLKAGVADAFTVFLDTISCFGNVMSYIRLFAVGMAGLAISQSFNDIAFGFKGPLVIVAVVVLLIGHGLNLIMCFLSVVVHGVRLNVLEFSGQVGLEWTGIEYEPFQKNQKIKK